MTWRYRANHPKRERQPTESSETIIARKVTGAVLAAQDTYTGPPTEIEDWADLEAVQEHLTEREDRVTRAFAAGQLTPAEWLERRAVVRAEVEAAWSAAWDGRPNEQKVLAVMDPFQVGQWSEGTVLLDEAGLDPMNEQERADFFGAMRAANLIAQRRRWDGRQLVHYYRPLHEWETTAPPDEYVDAS